MVQWPGGAAAVSPRSRRVSGLQRGQGRHGRPVLRLPVGPAPRATGTAGSQRVVVTAGDSSHTKIVSRLEHVPG